MHNLLKANGFPNVWKTHRERERYKGMTKMEILKNLRLLLEEGELKEDDFFDASVFFYLSGRYPDLSIYRCVEVVQHIRKDILQED